MIDQYTNIFLIKILGGIVLLLASSCSPHPVSGLYQSKAEDGILMAGYAYHFFPDSTFSMQYWSDDIAGNRQGQGVYQIQKDWLVLTYTAFPAPKATYTWYPLEEMDNGMQYFQFKVQDQEGLLLVGLMVELQDIDGTLLAQGVTDSSGRLNVSIEKSAYVQRIQFRYLGMESLEIIPQHRMSSGFDVIMVPVKKYVSEGTVEKLQYRSTRTYLELNDSLRSWRVYSSYGSESEDE